MSKTSFFFIPIVSLRPLLIVWSRVLSQKSWSLGYILLKINRARARECKVAWLSDHFWVVITMPFSAKAELWTNSASFLETRTAIQFVSNHSFPLQCCQSLNMFWKQKFQKDILTINIIAKYSVNCVILYFSNIPGNIYHSFFSLSYKTFLRIGLKKGPP